MSASAFEGQSQPSTTYLVLVGEFLDQPADALDGVLEMARTSSDVGSYEEIDAITASVDGANFNVLYGALNSLGVIVRDLTSSTATGEEIYQALMPLAPDAIASAMQEHQAFLVELLNVLIERRDVLATKGLAVGPGLVVTAVTASVMLAAAMRSDDQIDGYLPLALVRIDTNDEPVIVQFDERRLQQFIEDLQQVARRLDAVRRMTFGALPVYPRLEDDR